MKTCPAPWCNRQLGDSESHPGHDAMMTDPDWEYFAVKDPDHPTAVDVFRRPRKKKRAKPEPKPEPAPEPEEDPEWSV